jgi:hypothetical protein
MPPSTLWDGASSEAVTTTRPLGVGAAQHRAAPSECALCQKAARSCRGAGRTWRRLCYGSCARLGCGIYGSNDWGDKCMWRLEPAARSWPPIWLSSIRDNGGCRSIAVACRLSWRLHRRWRRTHWAERACGVFGGQVLPISSLPEPCFHGSGRWGGAALGRLLSSYIVPVQGASTANFAASASASGLTNANMSTLTPNACLIYPAS